MKKRVTLHLRNCDRKILDEYISIYKKTGIFPKKLSKEGFGEYYRHVIIGRLQNRTYADIAKEHGISSERVRQIFYRFNKFCEKRGHSLERELVKIVDKWKINKR